MTLLLIIAAIAATWIGICVVVAGICMSAADGDRMPPPVVPVPGCAGRRRSRGLRALTARRSIAHR